MSVRPVILEDARPIAEILLEVELERKGVAGELEPPEKQIETALEYYAESDSHEAFVAEVNGEILGYLAIQWLLPLFNSQLEGYVSDLFVQKSFRGQGVGGHLLEHIVVEARARDCRRLTLVNIKTEESYTRGFYPQQGWVEQDAARFVLKL